MDVEVMSEVEKRWRNGTGGELIRGFLSEVEGSGGHVAWCWLPTASEGSWGECEPVVWPEQGVVVRTSFYLRDRPRCSLQPLEHSGIMVYHCFPGEVVAGVAPSCGPSVRQSESNAPRTALLLVGSNASCLFWDYRHVLDRGIYFSYDVRRDWGI
jgi:hypothetical protein